jgi:hypothetical protein
MDEKMNNNNEKKDYLARLDNFRTGKEVDCFSKTELEKAEFKQDLNELKTISSSFLKARPQDSDEIFKTVDKTMLQHIRQRSEEIQKQRKIIPLFVKPVVLKRMAAAAVVIFVCIAGWNLYFPTFRNSENRDASQVANPRHPAIKDFDGNGRIDIVDAYLMNSKIKAGINIPDVYDFNSDGLVNESDVNIIVQSAVSLGA